MSGKRSSASERTIAAVAAAVPKKKQGEARQGPTPEQRKRAPYERVTVRTDREAAVAYARQPLFETLYRRKGSGIDAEGLAALRFYRERHEATASSPTRCALDIQARGGGLPSCLPPGLDADFLVRVCEAAMGAVVDTVRAVALEDRSFSEVAIARFGGRKQDWLIVEEESGRQALRRRNAERLAETGKVQKPLPRFEEKIVPRSGRHREIIREEFLLGLKRLIEAVRPYRSTEGEA